MANRPGCQEQLSGKFGYRSLLFNFDLLHHQRFSTGTAALDESFG
jgi:hypothetical protein